MAAAMFVLSLGQTLRVGNTITDLPLPWLPVSLLPLLEHALPGRLTLYMWLAIAAMLAVVVSEVTARGRAYATPRRAVLALALALIVPAPLASSTTEVPEFFRSFDRQDIADDAVVLIAPHFTNGAGAAPMRGRPWPAIGRGCTRPTRMCRMRTGTRATGRRRCSSPRSWSGSRTTG